MSLGRGRRPLLLTVAGFVAAAVVLALVPPGALAAAGRTASGPGSLASGPAGSVPGAAGLAAGAEASAPVSRVLMLSLPGLTWADLQEHDLPAIEAFLEDAGVADLATRAAAANATAGGAYLTISAGSRAASPSDVDGQQLGVDELASGSEAGEIFRRRTGTAPAGDVVSLSWPSIERETARQPFDAELGRLTDTLTEAGLGAVAIGNADGTDTIGISYERQVALAVTSSEGVVPAGVVDDNELLVDDVGSAFGQRLDPDAVVRGFREAWRAPAGRDGGLVVVEASDLARTMRYRSRVDGARYDALWAQALADTDRLVGQLLAEVDPARDAVMLLAPYNLPGDRDLTVAALQAPGEPAGYMRSASTQRDPFVTLVDVGPAVLDLFDLQRPVSMEGRPFEVVASNDSLDERVDRLASANEASRFRERLLFPTTLVAVLILAVVCAAAAVVLARGGTLRARRLVTVGALATMALLPMSYLARGFPLQDIGIAFYWAFVVTGAVVVAVAVTAAARRLGRPRVALVSVLALVLLVVLADAVAGSRLNLSAAFGYSPTGNSRLYGVSNYGFGQVAGAGSLLAALLAATLRPRRWAQVAAVGLLVGVLVVLGVPIWGSNVGASLAFTPTILVFAALLAGRRIRLRHVVVVGFVTVVTVVGFGLLDLARPEGERAHLGRLIERVNDDGFGPLLSIIERKFVAAIEVTATTFWTAAIPIAVAFIVFLARYPTRPLARLGANIPTLRIGLTAAAVAAVLGSLFNDSGTIVGGGVLLVVAASLVHLAFEPELVRRSDPSDSPAPPDETEPSTTAPTPAAHPQPASTSDQVGAPV